MCFCVLLKKMLNIAFIWHSLIVFLLRETPINFTRIDTTAIYR